MTRKYLFLFFIFIFFIKTPIQSLASGKNKEISNKEEYLKNLKDFRFFYSDPTNIFKNITLFLEYLCYGFDFKYCVINLGTRFSLTFKLWHKDFFHITLGAQVRWFDLFLRKILNKDYTWPIRFICIHFITLSFYYVEIYFLNLNIFDLCRLFYLKKEIGQYEIKDSKIKKIEVEEITDYKVRRIKKEKAKRMNEMWKILIPRFHIHIWRIVSDLLYSSNDNKVY